MANPKRKTSKSKKNMRRSHHALRSKSITHCPNCSEMALPHRACPSCGHYKGRHIVTIPEE